MSFSVQRGTYEKEKEDSEKPLTTSTHLGGHVTTEKMKQRVPEMSRGRWGPRPGSHLEAEAAAVLNAACARTQSRLWVLSEQLCLARPVPRTSNNTPGSASPRPCAMPFVEDPAHLSKTRLKSDLIAHNVELPPAASKKEAYVELHLRHIDQANAADFSSDDEEPVQEVAEKEEVPEVEMPDPSTLTDDDLKAKLLKHGVKAGPIVASTRMLYERKLKSLVQSDGHGGVNGAEKAALYSDSEEEEDEGNGDEEDKESGLERMQQEAVEEQTQQQSGEVPPQSVVSNGCSSTPPQSFSITQMMESQSSLSPSADKELNRSNMQEHWSWSNRPAEQIADKYRITEQSLYYTPKDSPRGQGMKLSQEPVTDILKDLIPEIATTPTGIFATSRRPIKGAAQRPVQYAYPDTPVSPVTLERREVERRLVPIHVQILVFLTLAFILYFIYVHVEDSSSVLSLLDSFSQWSDTEEGALSQAKPQET